MTVFNARNWRMASLSTPLLLLLACSTTGGEPGAGAAILPPIADPPTRSGAPTVLIAMPNSPNFVEVRRSLVSEVQKSFNVHTVTVAPETTVADLASAIRSVSPVCVVLMNNATMNLYRQYQTANPTAAMPPAVLLMASLVEEVQARLRRATGIAY